MYNTEWPPTWKTWKVREFHIGQWKVREIRKSLGNYGLPVTCYHSCDSYKINTIWVLLSKVDMHKMGCQLPKYSLRSTHKPVTIPLILMPPWEIPGKSGKVGEFDKDWRATPWKQSKHMVTHIVLIVSLLRCCPCFSSVPHLSILAEQAKTFYISLDTISACLPWPSRLYSSISQWC